MKPDPNIDPIAAIFYHVCSDTSNDNKSKKTGIFTVDPNISGNPNQSNSRNINKRDILRKTGFVSCEVSSYSTEVEMLIEFALFIQNLDPDIILGYEVQMLSWGYLIERAAFLEVNMCQRLSRIPDKEKQLKINDDSEKDELFGQLITMSITGRIILNVWRVMRSEVRHIFIGIFCYDEYYGSKINRWREFIVLLIYVLYLQI